MRDTNPAIYIMFAAISIIALVWWKQGLMPWWFAFLVPFTTIVGLMQHRPERMMAGAIVMAGIANACWPYRGIRYMERNQGSRGNAVFARFFTSPIGIVLYRLSGLGHSLLQSECGPRLRCYLKQKDTWSILTHRNTGCS